jgi:hypothetical protein
VAINTSPAVVRKTSYDVTLGGGGLVMNTVLAPLSTPAVQWAHSVLPVGRGQVFKGCRHRARRSSR